MVMTETRRRYHVPQADLLEPEDEESFISSSQTEEDGLWKARRLAKHQDESVPVVAVVSGLIMSLALLLGLVYWLFLSDTYGSHAPLVALPCDTVFQGYQCDIALSHNWGQYSPFYKVPSDLPGVVPTQCEVTLVQLLSRHGARFPTTDKSAQYNATVSKIKSSATHLTGSYQFLTNYTYELGAEDLTPLGQQELINSGVDFFSRYERLAEHSTPFLRAGDQDRVVESARKWSEGFHKAKVASGKNSDKDYPYHILEISEADGMNNTLSHGLCHAFEANRTGPLAQMEFGKTFLPGIVARLKKELSTDDIDELDALSLMDMCPFTVVAETSFSSDTTMYKKDPSANPFCALFSVHEWEAYDYLQSIGKYYAFGPGSSLGPTQGVGFVNELIARLTSSPVEDHTSVNRTLDMDPAFFPLDRQMYADFSHDNDMTAIFSALGMFEDVPTLAQDRIMSIEETAGFAASRVVPFGGRIAVERLSCDHSSKEMVRVILNGRVWPMRLCAIDDRGMCSLQDFVQSLHFAATGGLWDKCFKSQRPSTLSGTEIETF